MKKIYIVEKIMDEVKPYYSGSVKDYKSFLKQEALDSLEGEELEGRLTEIDNYVDATDLLDNLEFGDMDIYNEVSKKEYENLKKIVNKKD